MEKIKITAVSYMNTLPFVYGLKRIPEPENFELSLDVPAMCAEKMLAREADFGLVPVAVVPQLQPYYKMLDYCIAADGEVGSVLLLSRVPLENITELCLDTDSRTSVVLVRMLSERFWKIKPKWNNNPRNLYQDLPESLVVIGDKAFSLMQEYPFRYDLSTEWKKYTGLPFVFAVWMVKNNIPREIIAKVLQALELGLSDIDAVVREQSGNERITFDLKKYLTHNICFRLSEPFRRGMELFLKNIENFQD